MAGSTDATDIDDWNADTDETTSDKLGESEKDWGKEVDTSCMVSQVPTTSLGAWVVFHEYILIHR